MTPEALEALKASILKWDKNAAAETPEDYKTGVRECPLCKVFYGDIFDGKNRCLGCPVAEKTGLIHCTGTPYGDAEDAHEEWEISDGLGGPARAAAREEAAFLRSLLPDGETA